MLKYFILVFID